MARGGTRSHPHPPDPGHQGTLAAAVRARWAIGARRMASVASSSSMMGTALTRSPEVRMPDDEVLDPLAAMVVALSADAVTVQRMFDQAYEDELVACRDAVALLSRVLGTAAAALAPSRLALRTYEVETRVRLAIDRTKGVEVKVSPLNLGYDLRYETSATQDSRIRLQVVQAPPRAEATTTTEEGERHGGPAR